VDRVCPGVTVVNHVVESSVERYHEWIVEQPTVELEALNMLSSANVVVPASSRAEFELYEMRKYWCLNGAHIAAAAYSYNYDDSIVLLSDALTKPDVFAKFR